MLSGDEPAARHPVSLWVTLEARQAGTVGRGGCRESRSHDLRPPSWGSSVCPLRHTLHLFYPPTPRWVQLWGITQRQQTEGVCALQRLPAGQPRVSHLPQPKGPWDTLSTCGPLPLLPSPPAALSTYCPLLFWQQLPVLPFRSQRKQQLPPLLAWHAVHSWVEGSAHLFCNGKTVNLSSIQGLWFLLHLRSSAFVFLKQPWAIRKRMGRALPTQLYFSNQGES